MASQNKQIKSSGPYLALTGILCISFLFIQITPPSFNKTAAPNDLLVSGLFSVIHHISGYFDIDNAKTSDVKSNAGSEIDKV